MGCLIILVLFLWSFIYEEKFGRKTRGKEGGSTHYITQVGNPQTAKTAAHPAVTTAYNSRGWLTSRGQKERGQRSKRGDVDELVDLLIGVSIVDSLKRRQTRFLKIPSWNMTMQEDCFIK